MKDENIQIHKKIILPLGKLLYEKIENNACDEGSTKSQFIRRIISIYLGIEYSTNIKKNQSNKTKRKTNLANRGKILSLSLTLNKHLYLRVKEEAEREKLSILQFIYQIIIKHLGVENSEVKSDQPQKPHKRYTTKGKLLTLYLGIELHKLVQEEAKKRNLSKFELIHKILQEYLKLDYHDITARNKSHTEPISESKQISLHLNDELYDNLEDKAEKEGLKVSQFVRKIIEEYLGFERVGVKRRQYNKFDPNMKLRVSLAELWHIIIEEWAKKENKSKSEVASNAIEKYLSMEHSSTGMSFYNSQQIVESNKTFGKNKFKKMSIYLNKHTYLVIEEKIKKENTSRVKFIRKAIIEYLLMEHPDIEINLYNNSIRNYEKRSVTFTNTGEVSL